MELVRIPNRSMSEISQIVGVEDLMKQNTENNWRRLTPLHYAVWYNQYKVVGKLLESKADVMARDIDGMTPLHYAVQYKKKNKSLGEPWALESLRLLLKAGADVNAQDTFGTPPISLAVQKCNKEMVQELAKTPGIDRKCADFLGMTPLHYAVKKNNEEIATILQQAGFHDNHPDHTGETPFLSACITGNLKIINMFLDAKPEKRIQMLSARTNRRETALHCAVENKRTKTVQYLLKEGLDPLKTCRKDNSSAIHIAAKIGATKITRSLLACDEHLQSALTSDKSTALHIATRYGRLTVAELLIEQGSDVEAQDIQGRTPLAISVLHANLDLMSYLLDNGACLLTVDDDKRTVLHHAVSQRECLGALKSLCKTLEKANLLMMLLNSEDKLGNTPLHLAASIGHPKATEYLLRQGANVLQRNIDDATALHLAAKKGFIKVVSVLLEWVSSPDADESLEINLINGEDEDSNTALHLAANNGHIEVVKCLLQAVPQTENMNRYCWTPLHAAAYSGSAETLQVFLDKGADVNTVDRKKGTPLHVAARFGHVQCAQLLLQHEVDLTQKNSLGQNPLDVAIAFDNSDVAMAIIQSYHWRNALRNCSTDENGHMLSPMRKLIDCMPEVALCVLDKCISSKSEKHVNGPNTQVTFDFEFVDDTYHVTAWGNDKEAGPVIFDNNGNITDKAKPYTTNSYKRQANHPMMYMVHSERTDILRHPVVLALGRHKWRISGLFYFAFLIYYILFVGTISTYFIRATPPYVLRKNLTAYLIHMEHCDNSTFDNDGFTRRTFFSNIKMIMWPLAIIGIATEALQFYTTFPEYFSRYTNILDWLTYPSAIATFIPILPCSTQEHWQWQLGTLTMFAAWINLILYMRRLPKVGILIVMVGQIFITFVQFFAFCFSLFIIAFGFTFYALLRNQPTFHTIGSTMRKMAVMMIGELDYEDLFNAGPDEFGNPPVPYQHETSLIYFFFVCMMTIIIMNLLTGLAVGDVQGILDTAQIKQFSLYVDLILDVEASMPEFLRKKMGCVVSKKTIYPKRKISGILKWIQNTLTNVSDADIGQSALRLIKNGSNMENDSSSSSVLNSKSANNLDSQVVTNQLRLDSLHNKLDNITIQLERLLESQRALDKSTESLNSLPTN